MMKFNIYLIYKLYITNTKYSLAIIYIINKILIFN